MNNNYAVSALAKHLKEKLNIKVYENWPDSKDKMVLPSISLLANNRQNEKYFPELVSSKPNIDNPDLKDSVYIVGHFDFTIQLDAWTEYKHERVGLVKKIEELFFKEFIDSELPSGITLTMTEYNDTIARYDIVGYNYIDSDTTASKSEFRLKMDILVSHPETIKKTENIMKDISLEQNTSEQTEFNESNLDVNEI